MQTREIGEPVTLFSDWWDGSGGPAEPSAITLVITHPDGTVNTFNKAACIGTAGSPPSTVLDHWEHVIVPDTEGVWRYTFTGTVGANSTEQGGMFLVGAGSATSSGPCEPWTTWADVEACGPSSLTKLSTAQQELVIDLTSETMFNLSGRVYPGICEFTRSLCFACTYCYPAYCGCEPYYGIDLGKDMPVYGAWDVMVDGATLAPSAYKVIGRRWLTRTDGHVWPTGWNSAVDPSQFRASWASGRAVPSGGREAARLLAVEIAKSCASDASCQLPQRVTNITREGVTYTIVDAMRMIDDQRTGLYLVDLWLESDKKGRLSVPRLFTPALHDVRKIAQ
jgi:hypothetical protein